MAPSGAWRTNASNCCRALAYSPRSNRAFARPNRASSASGPGPASLRNRSYSFAASSYRRSRSRPLAKFRSAGTRPDGAAEPLAESAVCARIGFVWSAAVVAVARATASRARLRAGARRRHGLKGTGPAPWTSSGAPGRSRRPSRSSTAAPRFPLQTPGRYNRSPRTASSRAASAAVSPVERLRGICRYWLCSLTRLVNPRKIRHRNHCGLSKPVGVNGKFELNFGKSAKYPETAVSERV